MPMTPDQIRTFNQKMRDQHEVNCECDTLEDHETIIAELIEDSYENIEGLLEVPRTDDLYND